MFVEAILLIAMFVVFGGLLLLGLHVAYVLFGVSVLFTGVAMFVDTYLDTATGLEFEFFGLVVERIYGLMTNWILTAGTTFIFMGNMLDKSGIAERLLISTQELFGNVRGGMVATVALIGAMLAANTLQILTRKILNLARAHQVVVIALPRDFTASARPGEGGMLRPRSHAGRARSCSIQRSR